MIRLLMLCLVQSSMSVSGAFLLNAVLSSSASGTAQMVSACMSPKGLTGILLMLLSFAAMTYTLSMYRAATFIPVNTAVTFLVTVIASYLLGADKMTISAIAGMVMITIGISLVLRA